MRSSVTVGFEPDDQVSVRYSDTFGTPSAALWIGRELTISADQATPEALRQLAKCALELADWREQQDQRTAQEVA